VHFDKMQQLEKQQIEKMTWSTFRSRPIWQKCPTLSD